MKNLSKFLTESMNNTKFWKNFENDVLDKIKVNWKESDDDAFDTVKEAILNSILDDKLSYIDSSSPTWNPMKYVDDGYWVPLTPFNDNQEICICVQLYRLGFDEQHPERAYIEISMCNMCGGLPATTLDSYYIKK